MASPITGAPQCNWPSPEVLQRPASADQNADYERSISAAGRCGARAQMFQFGALSTARARSGHAAAHCSRLAWIAEALARTWPALPHPH